jgi:hypothetical protein
LFICDLGTKYTTRACDFCKQRHLRCTGENPCFQCSKRNQQCAYTQKNVKRGPKPKRGKHNEESNGSQNDYNITPPLPTTFVTSGDSNNNIIIEKEIIKYRQLIRDYEKKYSDLIVNPYFRTISPSIPDLSKDMVHNSYMNFFEKVNPVFPNSFKINFPLCYELLKPISQNNIYVDMGEIVQYLVNCVILGHGFRIQGNEQLANNFILKCEEYINLLFSSSIPSQIYYNYHDDIISSLCAVGAFKVQAGEFNSARQFYLQAFNVLNMHVSDVNPIVSHSVYANLAGMSRSTSDMSHWVDNAHLLGREAGTLVNRVFLSLLYCSPSMLRDPKNKPLPPYVFIPDNHSIPENDLLLFKGMLVEFDETEDLIQETEKSKEVHGQSDIFDDYINSYYLIIYGCRSLVLAQCGYKDQAQECSEKCLQFARSMKQCAFYFAMALGLSYALQVLKTLGHSQLSEGIPMLETFRSRYPVVAEMINILYAPPPETLDPNVHIRVEKNEMKVKGIDGDNTLIGGNQFQDMPLGHHFESNFL